MRRKLVQQGAATLMVSLPRSWTKKYGLKKGDEIDIQEVDSALHIASQPAGHKREAQLNLTQYTESAVRTAITNAYRAGYNSLTVTFRDERQYALIVDTISTYLMGFDITSKEGTTCVIESITEPSDEQFDAVLQKILGHISLLLTRTEERLRKKTTFEDYKTLVHRIHQYDNFCRRVLSRANLYGSTTPLVWSFLNLLIHGQRELYHLNKLLDAHTISFTHFDFFDRLKRAYQLLVDGYAQRNLKLLEELHTLEKEALYVDFYKLLQKNSKENLLLYHLGSSLRTFYLASSPLMGMLLSPSTSK